MKKLIALVLVLCLAMALVPALAEGTDDLTILSENFIVRESYSNFEGIYMAKVQNNTDHLLYLSKGNLALLDADGNLIGTSESVYPSPSRYLEPGETALVNISAKVDEGATVADYKASIKSDVKGYYSEDKIVPVADVELSIDYNYNNHAIVTVTSGDEPLYYLNVIVAVEDENGNILDVAFDSMYSKELGANSTIRMWVSLDNKTMAYCQENGITPVKAEAFAWVEVK